MENLKYSVERLVLQLDEMDYAAKKNDNYTYWLKKSSSLLKTFGLSCELNIDDLSDIQEPNYLIKLAANNNDLHSALTELVPCYDGALTPKTIEFLTYLTAPYIEAWSAIVNGSEHQKA
ncbi:hypothetical protein L1D14_03775 [Vibrio tubiashii]|uniref:hypothetical protein n=1 Tax=Vibrio tubiashii TaxID=29498 RepID=UPI001EFD4EB4|nr:hypothetical protein [Vibrio tubiashii]MCG9575349.1 hypothetical protein [Vibrio tubiashii]